MRINLISGPRNISTALMYSFAQRPDTTVVDEPLYAYYLATTGLDHPGREEVLESMSADAQEVIAQVMHGKYPTPHVFFKGMAHHLIGLEPSFLLDFKNVFLIRNPHQLIASFAQVIPHPTMLDIGLEQQRNLFVWLWKQQGARPIVVDSNWVLQSPKRGMQALCEALGLPFTEKMLSWKPGPIEADGVWAKYWYANVHRSMGFEPQPTSSRPLPPQCEELYKRALPLYEELSEYALR